MLLRHISAAFDPVYLKPKVVTRAIRYMLPLNVASTALHNNACRSEHDRRKDDRRQHKQKVLLDLRSPHSRRNRSGRRHLDSIAGQFDRGIDQYA